MTNKMREEFEATWADVMRGDDPAPGRKPLRSLVDPDRYRGDAVNFAWNWWQRSRESLVVELPDYLDTEKLGFPAYDAAAVDAAIEAVGLKVAP